MSATGGVGGAGGLGSSLKKVLQTGSRMRFLM